MLCACLFSIFAFTCCCRVVVSIIAALMILVEQTNPSVIFDRFEHTKNHVIFEEIIKNIDNFILLITRFTESK